VPTALVIENDPTDDPCRLGEWLVDAGLELRVLRPHAGDAMPDNLAGYVALIVLGGDQRAYPGADGTPGAPWFPSLESLLRHAVRHRVPTLGICLGAQLLATAHGGTVQASAAGPEIGPALVARRDAAEHDPLFAPVPFAPDVLQWHLDEITELPLGATLLAASTRYPHQAFRLGDRAWGTQFHIECDTNMVARWAAGSGAFLAELGLHPEELVAACDGLMGELEDTWQPFAWRFAALALGRLPEHLGRLATGSRPAGESGTNGPRRSLPLLGQ
jgi:GMP synthase-like glutamine amidotransferase